MAQGDEEKKDGESRDERLKAALRANLRRRKAQAKARRDKAGDDEQQE